MRRHLVRTALRASVVLAGDAAALVVLRVMLEGIRDMGGAGGATSSLEPLIGGIPLVQLVPAILLGLVALGTYGATHRRHDAGRLVAGATIGLALPFWGHIWNQFSPAVILTFILAAGVIGLVLIAARKLIDQTLRKAWPSGPGAARAVLISRPAYTRSALEHPTLADSREFVFKGIADPEEFEQHGSDVGVNRLCQTIKRCRADTVVLSGPLSAHSLAVVIEASGAAGCQLYAIPRAFALDGVESELAWFRGAPLIALNRPRIRGRQLLLKRIIDIAGSAVGLVILSPVMAAISLAIRIDSHGPVVFSQRRVGRGGRLFRCYKFRSMKTDAEEQLRTNESLYDEYRRNHFKLPEEKDPRLTRVGRVLRKTSLDELPQFWNVLRGEMSLVGPRPVVPEELSHYGDGAFLFLSIKPGMTGAWAVGGRSQVGYPDRTHIELAYVREWTLWKDFGLLLKTIPAVLYMRGAS
jgi:exopolysaccharide biosynthesis polyprenyl glycosylphosphotransferase